MLELIHLKNFKCFDSKKIGLSKITILSGINGSGKTSFLNAIGVISQTISETNSFDNLLLNGAVRAVAKPLVEWLQEAESEEESDEDE